MSVDLIELASRANRMNKPEDLGARVMLENMIPMHEKNQFNQERHDRAMAVATAKRDPKYWDEVNQIAKEVATQCTSVSDH